MERTSRERRPDAAAERRLRLRALLSTHRLVIVAAFAILVVAGAWVSYGAYAAPDTTIDERSVEEWTLTGELDHGAAVVETTELYPAGTRLEDRPTYFTAVSPEMTGEYVVAYDAPAGSTDIAGSADVAVDVELVYRSEADGAVYWRDAEPIATAREAAVEPGEPVAVDVRVAVAEALERLRTIESELGASPGEATLALVASVEVSGEIAGARRFHAETHEITIDLGRGTYAFEGETLREPVTTTERVEVTASPGPLRAVGGPAALFAGLAGLVAVVVASRRLAPLTAAERAWLAYRDDRDAYAELVTTASLPPTVADGPRATVDSLEALAELAIDLRSALCYDPLERAYLVVDDGLIYVFEPPDPPDPAGRPEHAGPLAFDDAVDEASSADAIDGAGGDGASDETDRGDAVGETPRRASDHRPRARDVTNADRRPDLAGGDPTGSESGEELADPPDDGRSTRRRKPNRGGECGVADEPTGSSDRTGREEDVDAR